ncbi:MAG: hypothetical protein ABIJ08_00610, partial [Nanoarchaeota archaeon]
MDRLERIIATRLAEGSGILGDVLTSTSTAMGRLADIFYGLKDDLTGYLGKSSDVVPDSKKVDRLDISEGDKRGDVGVSETSDPAQVKPKGEDGPKLGLDERLLDIPHAELKAISDEDLFFRIAENYHRHFKPEFTGSKEFFTYDDVSEITHITNINLYQCKNVGKLFKSEDGIPAYEVERLKHRFIGSGAFKRGSIPAEIVERGLFISSGILNVLIERGYIEKNIKGITLNSANSVYDNIFPVMGTGVYTELCERGIIKAEKLEESDQTSPIVPEKRDRSVRPNLGKDQSVGNADEKVLILSKEQLDVIRDKDELVGMITKNYHTHRGEGEDIGGMIIDDNEVYDYTKASIILGLTAPNFYQMRNKGDLFKDNGGLSGYEIRRLKNRFAKGAGHSIDRVCEVLSISSEVGEKLIELGVLQYNASKKKITGSSAQSLYESVMPIKNSERYRQLAGEGIFGVNGDILCVKKKGDDPSGEPKNYFMTQLSGKLLDSAYMEFSKLDLRQGFFRLIPDEEEQDKDAFRIRYVELKTWNERKARKVEDGILVNPDDVFRYRLALGCHSEIRFKKEIEKA